MFTGEDYYIPTARLSVFAAWCRRVSAAFIFAATAFVCGKAMWHVMRLGHQDNVLSATSASFHEAVIDVGAESADGDG